MLNYYLGRQPIFNQGLDVVGYEILFRAQEFALESGEATLDGDMATSQVILNTFLEVGLDKLVGEHQAFINLTRNFLLNENLLPPPSKKLVLEVLEHIDVDDEVVGAVKSLKARNYIVALDDFVYDPKFEPLVKLADIIKIDVRALDRAEVGEHVRRLRAYPVRLLAEKIEDQEEYEWCKGLGFDYFQGYFLCKPRMVKGRRLPASRLNILRMLARLQDPNIDVQDLEKIISEDVALSFKLLKYINSAAFSLRSGIHSLKHAIVYLGLHEVRHWANLVAISSVDDQPSELMVIALVRARMCQLLAQALGREYDGSTAFMVGLFSVLDAILGTPIEEVLEALPLDQAVSGALQGGQDGYGLLLQAAMAHEHGDWEQVATASAINDLEVSSIYLEAVDWAGMTSQALQ